MSKGSCLCGAISYQYEGALTDCSYCHCQICRKLTGAAFGAYGSVARPRFNWTHGESLLSSYSPTKNTKRWFCSDCGSFLMTEHCLEPDSVFISLGTLNGSNDIAILYHQFAGSRANWHQIDETLPAYDKWPD